MEKKKIEPLSGPIEIDVKPPGSKSITNRALLCAALADGISTLTGALLSDDTHVMMDSLSRLGIPIQRDGTTLEIEGCGGRWPNREAELFVKNSGTTIRFLTAMLGLGGGKYRVDGIERMRQRPIGDLVNALGQLGVNASAHSPGECPPVIIDSPPATGGKAKVKGNISSQYLSGLLMAAPLATQDIELEIEGKLISVPYVHMTLEVMRSFGVEVNVVSDAQELPVKFQIPGNSSFQATSYSIEPDASAASYFWAAAAICGGQATVTGLSEQALQGDVGFVNVLEKMGCEIRRRPNSIAVTGPAKKGVTVDMADISDTAQTLAVVALFVDGTTSIRGIAHNRVKETDRIGNLAIELRKLGAAVEEFEDGFAITPGPLRGAEIETYDDHRMAMSLALAGLRQNGVVILDPKCVSKTYPEYFEDLAAIGNSPK